MIRQVVPEGVEALLQVRLEALTCEPFSFGSSPGEGMMQASDSVRAMLSDPRQAVFGAFHPDLVGSVGVRGLPQKKKRHKAEISGMYHAVAAASSTRRWGSSHGRQSLRR